MPKVKALIRFVSLGTLRDVAPNTIVDISDDEYAKVAGDVEVQGPPPTAKAVKEVQDTAIETPPVDKAVKSPKKKGK